MSGSPGLPAALGIVLGCLFAVLSGFHWAWALGRGNLSKVVPTTGDRPVFRPGPFSTVVIALLLLAASGLCTDLGVLRWAPRSWSRAGVWVIAGLFFLRAIGDLRLVGFFKGVRETAFARLDTLLYSPLCLLIAGLSAWLALTAS